MLLALVWGVTPPARPRQAPDSGAVRKGALDAIEGNDCEVAAVDGTPVTNLALPRPCAAASPFSESAHARCIWASGRASLAPGLRAQRLTLRLRLAACLLELGFVGDIVSGVGCAPVVTGGPQRHGPPHSGGEPPLSRCRTWCRQERRLATRQGVEVQRVHRALPRRGS